MAELDAELEDMMNVAADGNYNLKILNDAFEGRAHENEDIELVRVGGELKIKKRTKRPPRPETAKVASKKQPSYQTTNIFCGFDNSTSAGTEKDPRLAAIMEEVMQRTNAEFSAIDAEYDVVEDDSESDAATTPKYDENADASNCMALVPVVENTEFDIKKRKRNRELLKMQAKASSTAQPGEAKVLYNVDDHDDIGNNDEGIFGITGIGIPGKSKKSKRQKMPTYDEEHKFYQYPEEESIEQVDRIEHEMQEMMRYLATVEDMMGGDDLSEIKKQLEITGTSVDQHSKAYNALKLQVDNINKDATSAIGTFNNAGTDVHRLLLETEQRKMATKVVIYEDDSEDEDASKTEGINIGLNKLNEESLNKQKEDIVDQLIGMNSNIRSFATDVEERL